ncbi:unnamed protein product [Plutella xylostella]|uniref:Conserved oligomeric Golgi complex subunit 7 n=1 Tax=Plutella xylostella TaxID=51655 RepID=A0A8S4FW15_PLUXY|nr:unnamed protein product [Plutella xylostella]
MDLKSFGEEEFDTKKWINKAWSTSGNQDKEVFVANTVSRLQLYMKQLTNSLDETTTQIVTSIPRVLQSASSLQAEGALLQQTLLSLEQKVLAVEEETGQSISSLQRIDQLKTRLENAATALRSADKWAVLARSLDRVLEGGVPRDQLPALADQLTAITTSLQVCAPAHSQTHQPAGMCTSSQPEPPACRYVHQLTARATSLQVCAPAHSQSHQPAGLYSLTICAITSSLQVCAITTSLQVCAITSSLQVCAITSSLQVCAMAITSSLQVCAITSSLQVCAITSSLQVCAITTSSRYVPSPAACRYVHQLTARATSLQVWAPAHSQSHQPAGMCTSS